MKSSRQSPMTSTAWRKTFCKAINGAGDALLNQNLEAAQAVIDGDIEIDALESSVIDQCVKLLAKQNPVATDLRVVVPPLRLAATFERMGDLACHTPKRPAAPILLPRCRPMPSRCSPKCRRSLTRGRPGGFHAHRPRHQDRRGNHPQRRQASTPCTRRPSNWPSPRIGRAPTSSSSTWS